MLAPRLSPKHQAVGLSIFLFPDDGILIEPNFGTRCTETALRWKKGRRLTCGPDAANQEKLGEEGYSGSGKSALGFPLYTHNWDMSIPEENQRRPAVYPTHYLNRGSRIPPLGILQELRGTIAHRSRTGRVRNRLVRPIDRMLGFSDVCGLRIRCGDIDSRSSFRNALHFIRPVASSDDDWRGVPAGQMSRLLTLREYLSVPLQSAPILWTSGDLPPQKQMSDIANQVTPRDELDILTISVASGTQKPYPW